MIKEVMRLIDKDSVKEATGSFVLLCLVAVLMVLLLAL